MIAQLRWFVVWLGYKVRPYDMLADRRRWFWQPRTPCVVLVLPEEDRQKLEP